MVVMVVGGKIKERESNIYIQTSLLCTVSKRKEKREKDGKATVSNVCGGVLKFGLPSGHKTLCLKSGWFKAAASRFYPLANEL